MLTISKLKRWSINYYIDTATAAGRASADRRRANGGLGEYYSEHETRTPVWLCAGDAHTAAALVGLTDVQRAGGDADAEVVARWLDDGVAPNGARGRAFGARGVHGFDLTFCAPKSVSLVRALRADEVAQKAIADAHTSALAEAMEYLSAHAGYTRVHNRVTGQKDLVRLPGLVAVAYQHETSRCGDPHLHTHVIVPNRQARADGQLVSIDGTSLYHEARAAGVIYQATLRRELNRSVGCEWEPVGPWTGMAEIAGIHRDSITAWSRRSSQLRQWAAHNLTAVDGPVSQAQLAVAQKATRPAKPEELAWGQLQQQWNQDARGLRLERAAHLAARAARRAAARAAFDRAPLAAAAEKIEKAAFTRADLVEIVGAQLPIDTEQSPRQVVEAAVDDISVRLSAPRAAHQREGHERFTLDRIVAEEMAVLDLVDARNDRSMLWVKEEDTEGLSPDQTRAVTNICSSPWLVQLLSAPAGAGKTTSMRALVRAAHNSRRRVLVLAPTGKAVDVAVREGAGDDGYTIAKALRMLRDGQLTLDRLTVVIVDEAAMVGTDDLRRLLTATTHAETRTVIVGDAHQLAPVKARGGMFAQLCTDLPWAQHLSEVWRMLDPDERSASLALRNGGPAPVRRAIGWYRTHDRLHCGDPIAMATDALASYRADIGAGKDTLLICDTTEMADALNQRLHTETIGAQADTVTAARGHRIGVGDLIITRRNDPTIELHNTKDPATQDIPVRNGHRWRVTAINPENHRIAAHRLDDNTLAVFYRDYVREHVTHGYAVTVHCAQGVTADTTHAVLGETTTRSMLYVALTRGRHTNTAYLYERTNEHEHGREPSDRVHSMQRGTSHHAGQLIRAIIANHDEQFITAHDTAAQSVNTELPEQVQNLLHRRTAALHRRREAFQRWRAEIQSYTQAMAQARERHAQRSRDQSLDYGIEI
ncbi:MobF family relaxase [Mycobacterium sp.]|uniref:MobF family relaxase n=1 Tax=Mycobacterium sp. TaxID=1785 RepID=UPI003F9D2A9C